MASAEPPFTLSKGAIDAIVEGRVKPTEAAFQPPLLQVLGSKAMGNNRVRAVLFDGTTIFQHGIIVHDEAERLFNEGRFDKYALIRVCDWAVSHIPKKENMSVLMVTRVEFVKEGKDVGQKLEGTDWAYLNTREDVAAAAPAAAPVAPLLKVKASPQKAAVAPIISSFKRRTSPDSTTNTLKYEEVAPVNVITPFYTSWVVRVRVTSKTPLKTYNNARGGGKLFSFDTVDETGELRFTAFNEEADKWYDVIERGRVYLISKGTVKPANKRFSSLNNENEVTLNAYSVIEPVDESAKSAAAIPRMRYTFKPLAELESLPAATIIDVIGVIRSVGELGAITSKKTGLEVVKREISIVDQSHCEARVTLWDDNAVAFAADPGEVITLKAVYVGDFMGKTLGTRSSSVIDIEPEGVAEVAVLRQWYHSNKGQAETFRSLSSGGGGKLDNSNRFIGQLTTKLVTDNAAAASGVNKPSTSSGGGNSYGDNPNTYSSVYGTISAISKWKEGTTGHLYRSCASSGCLKKVTDEKGDGIYYCSKCDKASADFHWRIMLSVAVADATGQTWITIFQENAEKLLGMKAAELAELFERSPEEYAATLNTLRFTAYNMRLGSRMDEYQGESRVRSSLHAVSTVDPAERSRRLLAMIPKMEQQLH